MSMWKKILQLTKDYSYDKLTMINYTFILLFKHKAKVIKPNVDM